ncbi:hypothetical protein A2U01_0081045, partial [Trifolium medium]|nr:hypothetical protein [Trifolium medium]
MISGPDSYIGHPFVITLFFASGMSLLSRTPTRYPALRGPSARHTFGGKLESYMQQQHHSHHHRRNRSSI